MRKTKLAFLSIVAASAMATQAFATATNKVVLNEANCVTGGVLLKNSSTDTGMIGHRIEGNGQNWLELLVAGEDGTSRTVNMQGYQLHWWFFKDSTHQGDGTITFDNYSEFNAVPQGTLITISEAEEVWYSGTMEYGHVDGYGQNNGSHSHNVGDGTKIDLSTGTANSTWHKHYYAGDNGAHVGALTSSDAEGLFAYSDYFIFRGTTTEGTIGDPDELDTGLFAINNDDWGMEILDADGNQVMDPVGEAESGWYDSGSGVGNDEMLKLEAVSVNTSGHATYDYVSHYSNALMRDGKESSMGVENKWNSGADTQDLTFPRTRP